MLFAMSKAELSFCMENGTTQQKLEEMILGYLKRNQDAGDTLEGIAKWWLELERIESSVQQVAAACDHLLMKGQLKKYNNPSGSTLYRSTGETKNNKK